VRRKRSRRKKSTEKISNQNNTRKAKHYQNDQNAQTTKHQTNTTIVHNTDKFPLTKYQILIRNFPPDTSPNTCKPFIDSKVPPYKHLRHITDHRSTALVISFKDHATAHKTNMNFGYHSFLDSDIYTSNTFGEGGYQNTDRTYNLCKRILLIFSVCRFVS